jgi:uncharacterized protein (UPF0332 family)
MQDGNNDFSVSRAYYAMFYVVQALLITKNLSFSTHSGIINAFGLHFIKTQEVPVEYHRAIITAERLRVKGECDITDEVSVAGTQAQIEWAEKFIELAQEVLG